MFRALVSACGLIYACFIIFVYRSYSSLLILLCYNYIHSHTDRQNLRLFVLLMLFFFVFALFIACSREFTFTNYVYTFLLVFCLGFCLCCCLLLITYDAVTNNMLSPFAFCLHLPAMYAWFCDNFFLTYILHVFSSSSSHN